MQIDTGELNTRPALSCEIEISPAFCDIDVMGVVYHGHYVRYLEMARSALLASIGYDYLQMQASGYAWPVVDMRLKYVRPVRFAQKMTVRATLTEWEHRLRIAYLMRDAETGQRLNTAYTVQVAVDMQTQEMCFVCPPALAERLGMHA